MVSPSRTFRLVIQRVGHDREAAFRIIAYGGAGINARAEFATLGALHAALKAALPDVVLDQHAPGSILFAGEVELDESQFRGLGLA